MEALAEQTVPTETAQDRPERGVAHIKVQVEYRTGRLSDPNGKVETVNTVVTAVWEPTEDGSTIFGFAFTSPLDQFNRKLGRLIAQGRLDTYREESRGTYAIVAEEITDHPADVVRGWLRTGLMPMPCRWLDVEPI